MKRNLYIVGDSTLSKFNDTSYLYPRYGYGTQLYNFINEDEINIVNLALSGRSSKSFLLEENYKFLVENIKENDFLLIGFGHNNEKSDDVARFTSANLPFENENSFMYSLYTYYIKLALDNKAIPILCTPIVRLKLDGIYEGYSIHVTENGDYRKNILDLASKIGILGIDLTTPTKELFENLSIEDSCLHHAITAGKMLDGKITPNFNAVDKAHLNIYGARYVAYLVARNIQESDCELRKYLLDNVLEPKIDVLNVNPLYKVIEYESPDILNYKSVNHFKVEVPNYFGTAFGDVSTNPLDADSGYKAYSCEDKFIVGQIGEKLHGKFHSSADGFAGVFRQVSIQDNFVMTVKAKVIEHISSKQTSFGLMLRDDMYLNQSTSRESTMNNYVSAGFLTLNVSMNVIHARECTTELNMSGNIIDGFYNLGDEAILQIERLGQVIKAKVIYKDNIYYKEYIDFDLTQVDRKYCYIGMYSTCGTVVEFKDVEFLITGKAIEA